MKRLFIYSTIFLLLSSSAFSQITLSLLNGRKISLESYTNHDDEEYIEYQYKKKSGRLKTFYSDYSDIYSISIDGVDSIYYFPEDENSFSVDDMGRTLEGMQFAENEYKQHWWAFAAGAVVAGTSLQLPTYGTVKIVVPVAYLAAMAFVKPSKKEIYKKYPQFVGNNYFAYGFQRTARKKIIISTSFGMLAGFVVSGTAIGIKNLVEKQ